MTEKYSWISKQLLENCLRSDKNLDVVIVNKYECAPAVGKGENFASDLIRVSIEFHDEEKIPKSTTLILKAGMVNEENVQDKLEEFDVFHKEIVFYREVLEKINNLLVNIDKEIKLAPTCFGTSESNPKYMALEDLRAINYENVDRKKGLTFKLSELVFKKLAYMHAASAVVAVENPNIYKSHNVVAINPKIEYFVPLFMNSIKEWGKASMSMQGMEKFNDILNNFMKTAMVKGSLCFIRDDNKFNVLNHGDLWINNIMFKFDEKRNPTDAVFVDFAVSFFGSPGIDIAYTLFSSTSSDLFEADWDRLIQIYYNELYKALNLLKYPKAIPTLTEIHSDILQYAMNGVMFSFISCPLRYLENIADADMTNLVLDTDVAKKFRETLYRPEELRHRLKYLLTYYDRKGFLQGLDV